MASNPRIIPIDYNPNASSQINYRLKPCILIWYQLFFSQLKWPIIRNRPEVTLQSACRPLLTNSHFNSYRFVIFTWNWNKLNGNVSKLLKIFLKILREIDTYFNSIKDLFVYENYQNYTYTILLFFFSLCKAMGHQWFIQEHQIRLILPASTQPNTFPLHTLEVHLVELWRKLGGK